MTSGNKTEVFFVLKIIRMIMVSYNHSYEEDVSDEKGLTFKALKYLLKISILNYIASFGSVEHLFRYLWNIFFGITEH